MFEKRRAEFCCHRLLCFAAFCLLFRECSFAFELCSQTLYLSNAYSWQFQNVTHFLERKMAELMVTINAANEDKTISLSCPPSMNAENLCTLVCQKLNITPVAKNLFALRKHDTKVFLAGNSFLEKVNNLDLRIRYKVQFCIAIYCFCLRQFLSDF